MIIDKTKNKNNPPLVVFTLSLAVLMSSIDTNIVNIALPTIEKSLNISFASAQWIAVGYLLAVTSLIVGVGRAGDIFGKRSIFALGIVIFTAASLFCGLADSIYMIILFRILQGIGGAVLTSLSFAIAGDLIPKNKLVQSMGVLTSMLPIGIALGPSVGGVLIGLSGWRAVFFFNVPIGILAFVLVSKFPEIPITEHVEKFDFIGVFILASILVCYNLGITFAENKGLDTIVIILIGSAVSGIAVFIFYEKKIEFPLVELSMFKNPLFAGSLAVAVLLYAVITGSTLIFPFYLQQAMGYSTSMSGLLLASGPIGCAIFSPVAGKISDYFGNYKVMMFGIAFFAFGAFMMSRLDIASSAADFSVTFFFFDGSIAFFQTPNNSSIISLSRPEKRGLSSGLLNLSRSIGQTTGSALLGAIFYSFTGTKSAAGFNPVNISEGMSNTCLVSAGIMIFALVIGFFTILNIRGKV
ncbi:MAG: MFS transporter [Clostridium sp.]|jgi:EmrB/QacA subfamily drug resistance transporter|uniref:MFS transporter n=1 Tax=Clostridium sp. TaxID=1506 RepID=UPI0025BC2A31|nr:MFS transporter [Clostridium sp.]MCH3964807.1 MFS transporter [Clostridium sp.]MCI1715278.1 MFS transporter [Clostridium sp.]MCI1799540.1 MFS transporter [Clostridium sp.]MCI1813461.1 MFS transporter [Clostridium sp.]MCI1870352.1 MFS transporter [Clostridium sp.]